MGNTGVCPIRAYLTMCRICILLTIKQCKYLAVCNLNLLLILRFEFDFEVALGWFGNCACGSVEIQFSSESVD